MNDIAVASKKGRRTLYTYFKSKEDIYMAVVESELEMLSGAMEKVAEQDIAPDTKILRLIETHLDSIKMVVFRNGTLRAGFFRDIWRVEAVRKNFDRTETKLFRQVLTEGKEKGILDVYKRQGWARDCRPHHPGHRQYRCRFYSHSSRWRR